MQKIYNGGCGEWNPEENPQIGYKPLPLLNSDFTSEGTDSSSRLATVLKH